jgi:hypothetical protein
VACLPIGILGRILAGEERGRFVKVIYDKEHTGGFLILTGESRDFEKGYDNWVKRPGGFGGLLSGEWLAG